MTSKATSVRQQVAGAVQQHNAFSVVGILERIFAQAFTGLVYPQIWEDPIVDMEALEISPSDHIVTIASGGCNIMSYLTASPASIQAVDLSPAHIALNRLKYCAAIHLPDQASFYQFFANANHPDNPELFDTYLAPNLDKSSVDFWNKRKGFSGRRINMFKNGFYHYGALGLFIGLAHKLSAILGVNYADFLASQTREEQKQFFETKMRPAINSRLVRFITANRISLFGLGIPPQQYEALAGSSEDGDIQATLMERTRKLMCDFDLSENYFAWQAFNRAYQQGGPVPPYLEPESFESVRANAHKATIQNRTITDLLENESADSKNCYILLDAQDWMNDQQLNELWAQIDRTANSGARVIYRTAGNDDILPGRIDGAILRNWHYDKERAEALHLKDRSSIYGGFHIYIRH